MATASLNGRTSETVRREIELERQELATAVEQLREGIGEVTNVTAKMRANLDLSGGTVMAEAVALRLAASLGKADAHAVVQSVASRATSEDRPFRDLLAENPDVMRVLSRRDLDDVLTPELYLGSAITFVEAALAAHEAAARKRGA